jgi:hypothetical protein
VIRKSQGVDRCDASILKTLLEGDEEYVVNQILQIHTRSGQLAGPSTYLPQMAIVERVDGVNQGLAWRSGLLRDGEAWFHDRNALYDLRRNVS